MIPNAIQEHIDGLLRQADEFEKQAEVCRKAARMLTGEFDANGKGATSDVTVLAPRPRPGAPKRIRKTYAKNGQPEKRKDWIVLCLKEAGRPMELAEILADLQARGHSAKMKRHVYYNAVYTTLNRTPDLFYKTEDGKWSLVEWKDKESA